MSDTDRPKILMKSAAKFCCCLTVPKGLALFIVVLIVRACINVIPNWVHGATILEASKASIGSKILFYYTDIYFIIVIFYYIGIFYKWHREPEDTPESRQILVTLSTVMLVLQLVSEVLYFITIYNLDHDLQVFCEKNKIQMSFTVNPTLYNVLGAISCLVWIFLISWWRTSCLDFVAEKQMLSATKNLI